MTFKQIARTALIGSVSALCLGQTALAQFTVRDETPLISSLEEVRIDGDFATEESANSYALIIYNSDYEEDVFDDLEVAKNDAEAMQQMFRQLGYRPENIVTLGNLSKRDLEEEILLFSTRIDSTKSVVVYYSGHGVSFEDVAGMEGLSSRNFIVPPDMRSEVPSNDPVARTRLLRNRVVDLSDEVLDPISDRRPSGLVVFYDACRDAALSVSASQTKSANRRPSFVPAQINGSAIFYSASPGETSVAQLGADDNSDLSLYTRVLISKLSKSPATRLRDLHPAISQQVSSMAASQGETQRPTWVSDLVYTEDRTEFCLAALRGPNGQPICTDANGQVGAVAGKKTATCEPDDDIRYWNTVSTSRDKDIVQSYLDRCPEGDHKILAQKRLSDIRAWEAARRSASVDQIRRYLRAYPDALFRFEATEEIALIEERDKQKAGIQIAKNTVGGGQNKGIEKDDPIAEIPAAEQRFWDNAKQQRDETLILIYQDMSQDGLFTGAFAADAEALLKKLEVEKLEKEENDLWQRVRYSKDIAAIRDYISAYPDGRNVAAAERRIDELEQLERDNRIWARAERRDSLFGYEDYLDEFPNGLHAKKASARIAEIEEEDAWSDAQRRGTLFAYQKYLRAYPNGRFAREASARVAEVEDENAWVKATQSDTLFAYKTYLREFRNGRFVREASARIEELDVGRQEDEAWNTAKRRNTVAAYNTYLSKYRSGKYASQARSAIRAIQLEKDRQIAEQKRQREKSAWDIAQRCGTSSCYADFARTYPSSTYASRARSQAQCPTPASSLNSANRAKHVVQSYYEALNDKRFSCAESYWAEMKSGRRNLIWNTAGAKIENISVGYSSGSQTRVEAVVEVRSKSSSWERWRIHMDVSTYGSSPKITDMGGSKLR